MKHIDALRLSHLCTTYIMSLHLRVSTYTNIIIKEYVNVGRASCSHITNTDYNAFHAWDWNIQIDEKITFIHISDVLLGALPDRECVWSGERKTKYT